MAEHPNMLRLLLQISLAGTAVGLSSCDVGPLEFPLQQVQVLSEGRNSLVKGIPAKIGTPAQNIMLLPQPELNNTWIYDDEVYCSNTVAVGDENCQVRRRNIFRKQDSSTYKYTREIRASEGAAEILYLERSDRSEKGMKSPTLTRSSGSDKMQVGSSRPLIDFPFGIQRRSWGQDHTMLHTLGLGSHSTYLNALRDARQITSRVWSLFLGRMWVDEPLDGSLVLGGYDEDKVTGQNYTAPLIFDDYESSSGCWTGMRVKVSDIKLNFKNGRDISLFPTDTDLSFCLVPQRQLLLEAPEAYISNFDALTETKPLESSYGTHRLSRLYDAKEAFDGDITFSLPTGLEIRVPNSQYMIPHIENNRNGPQIFENETRELLINGISDRSAILGGNFFTSAYLMVNHDAGTFTLWKANPSKTSRLVRVVEEETAAECKEKLVATLSPRDVAPRSVSGAVIGGSVAGSVVGLGAIALALFILLRRKRQSAAVQRPSRLRDLSHNSDGDKFPVEPQEGFPMEVQQFPQGDVYNVPQELYGSEPTSHESRVRPQCVFELEASNHR